MELRPRTSTLTLALAAAIGAATLFGCSPVGGAVPSPPAIAATAERAHREWMEAEIRRLREVTTSLDGDAANAAERLDGVALELAGGRTLTALSRLWPLRVNVGALADVRAARSLDANDDASLTEHLRAERETIAGLRQRLARFEKTCSPAAHRAFADAANNRADGLLAGAKGFASLAGEATGAVYYAAQARWEVATAVTVCELAGTGGRAPQPHGLAALLHTLERETTVAYRGPGAEVEQHTTFIALNALLKEARELLAKQRDLAALMVLLEARRRLDGVLATVAEPDVGTLHRRLEQEQARLAESSLDSSIARRFLQEATRALERAETRGEVSDSDADEEALRSVTVILEAVLPLYHRSLENPP